MKISELAQRFGRGEYNNELRTEVSAFLARLADMFHDDTETGVAADHVHAALDATLDDEGNPRKDFTRHVEDQRQADREAAARVDTQADERPDLTGTDVDPQKTTGDRLADLSAEKTPGEAVGEQRERKLRDDLARSPSDAQGMGDQSVDPSKMKSGIR
jgi:hypothetical protein